MNYIKIITDEDFGIESNEFNDPRTRLGARGIVFNNNKIAILHKQLKNEYKLVGGGIDENENPEVAFRREVQEEAGCEIEITKFLGMIKEEKSQDNFIQTSYVYIASVTNDNGNINYTEKELGEGSKLLWLDIDEAMQLIKESESKLKPSKFDGELSIYHTKFIVRRDYEILKYYKNINSTVN